MTPRSRTRCLLKAASALVDFLIEPALLDLTERMYVSLGFSELEKLGAIISFQICKVYARCNLEVRETDAAVALMAVDAVELAWNHMNDLRHAIVWSAFDEPLPSLHVSPMTFPQYMDIYLSVLGHRLGESEFLGLPEPPAELSDLVFRLLIQRNLEWVGPPFGISREGLREWLSDKLAESANLFVQMRTSLDNERQRLTSGLEWAFDELKKGTIQDGWEFEQYLTTVELLQTELFNLPEKPGPDCARFGWFNHMDWIDFSWLTDDQVEKVSLDLRLVGFVKKGVERELGRREGTILGMWWEPGAPPPEAEQ